MLYTSEAVEISFREEIEGVTKNVKTILDRFCH
jgi:hypothetical protein